VAQRVGRDLTEASYQVQVGREVTAHIVGELDHPDDLAA
jgi:hypothetical protein